MENNQKPPCNQKGYIRLANNYSKAFIRQIARWYVRNMPLERGKGALVNSLKEIDKRSKDNVITRIAPEIQMELDLNSHIERRIFYFGFYRPWVLEHFDRLLKPDQFVVDIGANVGLFSLWAANKVGSIGSIFAFEPEQICYKKLQRNIEINSLTTIKSENAAVSDFDGNATLYLNGEGDENFGQSSLAELSSHRRQLTIPCWTLDSYFEQNNIPHIDVLKIDTQGAELQVLRGAANLLEAHHPSILLRCTEERSQALGETTADIQELLLQSDYRLFEIEQSSKLVKISAPRLVEDGTFLALWHGHMDPNN